MGLTAVTHKETAAPAKMCFGRLRAMLRALGSAGHFELPGALVIHVYTSVYMQCCSIKQFVIWGADGDDAEEASESCMMLRIPRYGCKL
jgi:hypothetical protein